jgi:Holliday junction resolvase RusA-like endonuclease
MYRINIKPLSVNKAWGGRTFKSSFYKKYEKQVPLLLEGITVPKGKLEVFYRFGMSSANSDWDNPIKPFQDVLFRYLGVSDSNIHRGIVEKVKVRKGKEFIEFEITEIGGGVK